MIVEIDFNSDEAIYIQLRNQIIIKQEGFVKLDRRRGAVISLDADKIRAIREMERDLSVILARGACKNVSREEVHRLVDSIFDAFSG